MKQPFPMFNRPLRNQQGGQENQRGHAVPVRRVPGWDDTLPAGCISISAAARCLEVKRNELFAWLHESEWIAKDVATNSWVGCNAPIEQGLLAMRPKSVGFQRYVYQVVVTPQGFNDLMRRLHGVK